MNQVSQPTGLIKPFNLDQLGCGNMYLSPLPKKLVMKVSVLVAPDMCKHCAEETYGAIHDELIDVAERCISDAAEFNIPAEIVLEHGMGDELTAAWWPLPDQQNQWIEDGLYVQVTFWDPSRILGFEPSFHVNLCMTVYDGLVIEHGESDPAKQVAISVDPKLARDYRLLIGDVYAESVGVWNKDLVEFRNMVMIKCRAVLAGLDPDTEYAEYEKVGGYCLLYQAQRP